MEIKPIEYAGLPPGAQGNRRSDRCKAKTATGDRLDVLATLAVAWEEQHCPIESPDRSRRSIRDGAAGPLPAQLRKHTSAACAGVAEILNRKRPLTVPMIPQTASGLGIPAEVLIRENGLRPAG